MTLERGGGGHMMQAGSLKWGGGVYIYMYVCLCVVEVEAGCARSCLDDDDNVTSCGADCGPNLGQQD